MIRSLLLLLLPARALCAGLAAEPIPWQDGAPLAVPFLQLPFEAPETLPAGQVRAGLRTIYSNNIASQKSIGVEVHYHFETAQPSLVLRAGIGGGLELHLEAAVVSEQIAYFDPAVKTVESWFGTLNKLRKVPLSREPRFFIQRPGEPSVSFSGPQLAMGDVWFGTKGMLREQQGGAGPTLAWRAALKVPTGHFPFGSGVVEEGVGLLADYELGSRHLWTVADLMIPDGTVSRTRLPTRPHPAFQLGLGQDLGAHVTLLLQGSTHGSALQYMHMSEIDGWTFYVVAGVRVAPTSSFTCGLSLVENLIVTERGNDIAATFDFAWRW